MPVHGEYRMLKIHARTAQAVGVPKENCFILDNGEVLALTKDSARIAGKFTAGDVYVDGNGIGDIGNIVLRDRRILAEEGLVLAVATVNFKTKEILAGPDLLSRGFIYMRESGDLIHQAQRLLFNALRRALKAKNCNEASLNKAMVDTLQPFLIEQTDRHPIILPMIIRADL